MENAQFVKEFNAENHGFSLELNEFADFRGEELPLGLDETVFSTANSTNTVYLSLENVPEAKDWRTEGAVTEVKNQKQCGSCWAFSTTGSIEALTYLQTGHLLSFSEQQLVDCSESFGNKGCKGGKMDKAYRYIMATGGLATEKEYKYTAKKGKCLQKWTNLEGKISGFAGVPWFNEEQLKVAVAKQPVSVAVQANQKVFHLYKEGIIDSGCGHQLDHAVLLVGYGEEKGRKFWIVKNSWGPKWGEGGFVRILRQEGVMGPGMCGVATYGTYPY